MRGAASPLSRTGLLCRAADWLVEPVEEEPILSLPTERAQPLVALPPRTYPLVAVVGLARRCGATTVARALGAELAARDGGAAVVAGPGRPAVVGLGSSAAAVRLADCLGSLGRVRPAGNLCLAGYSDVAALAPVTRRAAPAVVEVEPGGPAVEVAAAVDQTVLVVSPELSPALAAAVAETIAAVASPPLLAVNRAADHGPWLMRADVLVPDSRFGARLALAGREPRGWLGRSIGQLADLCLAC